MSENESNHEKYTAIVIDIDTEEILGRISLVGDPVPATEWISANGPLQGFAIQDGRDHLWQVWANQEEVLLRTDTGEYSIRIVTYPTEGENQGYLDFTSELQAVPNLSSEGKTRILAQRGFAFLQSLFSL
jgi:hypothetical protein